MPGLSVDTQGKSLVPPGVEVSLGPTATPTTLFIAGAGINRNEIFTLTSPSAVRLTRESSVE